ncbi:MAG: hypothetical protein D8M58_18975 [Calditrichaeota bacterium]|nr:MAG: hypothetical protein DWQ03_21655 [Calditrichota bacterium]MBL1207494.1 hypothetical protein [Calditrichota bacterium]NOG47326.1 hypothetical protein [Calditrichota bacterium]
MKKIIFSLLAFIYFATAQDSSLAMVDAVETTSHDSVAMDTTSPIQDLSLDDYQKFYIGFTTTDAALEVITLDIKNVASADSTLTFQYTLNTHNNREVGTGNIWPGKSKIQFQNMEEGRISIPEDGKIVFESLSQDTLKYWKLKEK